MLQDLAPVQPEAWGRTRRLAVYILYSESDQIACEAASDIKQWLCMHGLDQSLVELHGDAKLAVSEVTEDALVTVADEVDAVVLVQTGNVLYEARSLARIYTAVRNHVPVIPVRLASTVQDDVHMLYSFDDSLRLMERMGSELTTDVCESVAAATHTSIASIGAELLRAVPNLISKRLDLDIGATGTATQMLEIETALRRATQHSGTTRRLPKQKLSEGLPAESKSPKAR